MMASRLLISCAFFSVLLLPGCRRGGDAAAGSDAVVRQFPQVTVPGVYTEPEDVQDYVLAHFWDSFLADTLSSFRCDSSYIAGVEQKLFATQLASYLSILETVPLEKAKGSISSFFSKIEKYQHSVPASNLFDIVCEAVEYYLYDPNSEIRDEDLYLPFITGRCASSLTPDSLRVSLGFAARMCTLNQKGTKAADFRFVDASGRIHSLYGEKAPATILVFVNPGCHACEELVDPLGAPEIVQLTESGLLKIIGVYIDEDIAAWKAESGSLPAHWINGYDPDFIIRKDLIYGVRAIPSIYLLDEDKTVILKDAPVEKLFTALQNI